MSSNKWKEIAELFVGKVIIQCYETTEPLDISVHAPGSTARLVRDKWNPISDISCLLSIKTTALSGRFFTSAGALLIAFVMVPACLTMAERTSNPTSGSKL